MMTRTPLIASVLMLSLIAGVPAAFAAEEKKPAKPAKIAPVTVDADKNGNITLAAAKKLAENQFALYDGDKDGSFDMKDYLVPFNALGKAKKIDMSKNSVDQKAIKESFDRMDKDKNNKISKAEFIEDAGLRHAMIDGNKDGVVTPAEIEALQKKMIAAHNKAKK